VDKSVPDLTKGNHNTLLFYNEEVQVEDRL